MICVVFQDLKHESKSGYSVHEINSRSRAVRAGVIPGAFGLPPIYCRHLHSSYEGERLLIISQTDEELSDLKREEIINGAIAYLNAERFFGMQGLKEAPDELD